MTRIAKESAPDGRYLHRAKTAMVSRAATLHRSMSIDRVFVIGAGLMGHGIAQVSAAAGKQVTLADRTVELAEKGRQRVVGNLARQVEKDKIDQGTADEIAGRIGTAEGTDGVPGHAIVIEAVFEDESVKRSTWEALSSAADADAIFASNTSSISITALAAATDRPQRFIGLHFFSPVPVMGLIEIIRGLETDDATHAACKGFAEELGKTVIESRDYPGFLVNRMLGPFINEAVFALMESTGTAEDIDTGAKLGLNHPMGPLELSDFIGNDVMLNVMDVLHRGFGDPKFRAAPLLRQMVTAGHLGRKTGRGFYRYDEQGKKVG
jgi:3-hydroxybutyryl-CoA dehydrogenase